jgi:hypothetical protein
VPFQFGAEPVGVQSERLCVPAQVHHGQRVPMLQQQVVHGPERALGGSRLGRFGGQLGARVHVGQRQVPPHVADGGVGEDVPDHRLGLAAVRALEVAALDDRDQRLLRAADVVPLRVNRGDQVLDEPGVTEQQPGPSLRAQQLRHPEHTPAQPGRDQYCRQRAELGLGQVLPGERPGRDEQRHREPDAA